MFKRIWMQLDNKRRNQIRALFLLMLLTAIVEMVSVGAALPFLGILTNPAFIHESKWLIWLPNSILLMNHENLLILISIIFGIFAVSAGLMRLVLIWAQTRLSYAIGVDFSVKMYTLKMYQSYEKQIHKNSGEILNALTNKSNLVVSHAIYPILNIMSSILILILVVGVLININYIVAISALIIFSAIYILVMQVAKKHLQSDGQKVNYLQEKVIKVIQEASGGIRDVIMSGAQNFYIKEYQSTEVPLRFAMGSIQIATVTPRFIIESIAMASIAAISLIFLKTGNSISNIVSVLGAIALGAQRILPLLQQCYGSWAAIKGGGQSVSDVLTLLEENVDINSEAVQIQPKVQFKKFINLAEVSFKYAYSSKKMVLDGVNLSISKGACIGIVGQTGGGKSTLVDLIMGLLEPVEGLITIDGLVINDNNVKGWQKNIAHVPQNIYLTDSTIVDNIVLGAVDVDLQLLRKVSQAAQLLETIESWSDGFMTKIGERGSKLSGGQRQRIGIARALYKEASLLILDEATSALDTQTEDLVMGGLRRHFPSMTTIIISHRLSSLKDCDKIYEVKKNKIYELHE